MVRGEVDAENSSNRIAEGSITDPLGISTTGRTGGMRKAP
jgi:hypothetical protein